MPRIVHGKCNSCGACVQICPKGVFSMSDNPGEPLVKKPEECTNCGICILDCAPGAIILESPNLDWDNFYVGGHA